MAKWEEIERRILGDAGADVDLEAVAARMGISPRQMKAAENVERLREESKEAAAEPSHWAATVAGIQTAKDIERHGFRPAAAGLRYAVTGQAPTAEELPEPETWGQREAGVLPYLTGLGGLVPLASDMVGGYRQQGEKMGFTPAEMASPRWGPILAALAGKEMVGGLVKGLASKEEWEKRPITQATMVLGPLVAGAKLAGKGLKGAGTKVTPPKEPVAPEPPRPVLEVTKEKPLRPIEDVPREDIPMKGEALVKPELTDPNWEMLERVLLEGEDPKALLQAAEKGTLAERPAPRAPTTKEMGREIDLHPKPEGGTPGAPEHRPVSIFDPESPDFIPENVRTPATPAEVDRWLARKGMAGKEPRTPKPTPRTVSESERLEILADVEEKAPAIRERAGVIRLTTPQKERLLRLRKGFEEGHPGKRYPTAESEFGRDMVWVGEPSTYPIHGVPKKLALRTIDKVLRGKRLGSGERWAWEKIQKDYKTTQQYHEDVEGAKYVREERRAERETAREAEAMRTPEEHLPEDVNFLDEMETEPDFELTGQHAVKDLDSRQIIADAQTTYGKGAAGKLRSQLDALKKDPSADPAYIQKVQTAIDHLSRGERGFFRFGKSAEDLATPDVRREGIIQKAQRPGMLLRKVKPASEPLRFEPRALENSERMYLKRVAKKPAKWTPAGEDPKRVAALADHVRRGGMVTEEDVPLWQDLQHRLKAYDATSPVVGGGEKFVNFISERVFDPARDMIGKTMTPFEAAHEALPGVDRTFLQDHGAAVFRGKQPPISEQMIVYVDTVREKVFTPFAQLMERMRIGGADVAGWIDNYFPQYLTREASDALRLGKGPLYEAIVADVGRTNNRMRTQEIVREMRLAAQRYGPVELPRRVTWPDYVDVKTPQGVARMRVIETDPHIVVKQYITNAAYRLSMIDAGFGDGAMMERFVEILRSQGREDLVGVVKDLWDDMGQKPLPITPGKAAAVARSGEAILRAQQLSAAALPNIIQGPLAGWAQTSTRAAGKAMFKALEDSVRRRIGAKRDWVMEKLPEWDVIRKDTLAGSGATQDLAEALGRGQGERMAMLVSRTQLKALMVNAANRLMNRYLGMLGVIDLKQTVQMWKAATNARARAAIADHAFRLYDHTSQRLDQLAANGITEQDLAHAARNMAERGNLWKPSGLYRGRFTESGVPRQIRAYGSFLHVTGSVAADALAAARHGQYSKIIKVMLGVGIAGPEVMRYVNNLMRDKPQPGMTDKEGNVRWGEVASRIAEDIIRSGNAHYWTLILDPIHSHYRYGKPWTEGLVDVPVLGAAGAATEAGIQIVKGTPVPEAAMGLARKINPVVGIAERQMSRPQSIPSKLGRAVGFDDIQKWTQGVRSDYLLTESGKARSGYLKPEAEAYRQELEEGSPDWKEILANEMVRMEQGRRGEPAVSWEEYRSKRVKFDPIAVFTAWKKRAYPQQEVE